MPSKRFNLNCRVDLPKDIAISNIENKYLVVAPDKGTYIVLDTFQMKFFNYLNEGHTLRELLNSQHYNVDLYPKLQDLLIQFEFRKFYESYQPNPEKHLSARIYITNACNLRCIHCFRHSGHKEVGELDFNDWKEILLKLRENGIQDISISGGEPFIFDGIYELIDYAVDIEMDVVVLSNGTKIDFEHISTLKKLKGIQLSVDGPNEKVNDEIRGKGVYHKAMDALDELYSVGIPVTISMVLFDKYLEEYRLSMEPFLNELKDKYGYSVKIRFNTGILPGREISNDKLSSLFYHQSLQKFIHDICIGVYGHEWLLQTYSDHLNLKFHTNCGYGDTVTIDPTGRIYPCTLTYYPIGDIHEDTISDILLKLKDLGGKFSVDNLEPCSKCDLKYICGGPCRVANRYLYDNMHEINCTEGYVQELQRILVEAHPFLFTAIKGGKYNG
jgi:radical SAM protein with 4Fe4S-binding SPASM domain